MPAVKHLCETTTNDRPGGGNLHSPAMTTGKPMAWDEYQTPHRFWLCVLTYRCLNGSAPHYLAETIRPVSSRGTRQHLRSAETSTLLVPSTRRSTLGDRSFPVAAARAWNALPQRTRLLFPSSAEN